MSRYEEYLQKKETKKNYYTREVCKYLRYQVGSEVLWEIALKMVPAGQGKPQLSRLL